MIIAIDIENGEAFGPFDSHEQADERIARFMVELGEWRRGESPATDTPLQTALEHFLDPESGAEGHEDRDSCRQVLCEAVDAASWQVTEMQPLEPGEGLNDDIHEARPEAPETRDPASVPADFGLGAARSAPGEQPVAMDPAQDQPSIVTNERMRQHVYECWQPRGGECRVGCSCPCHATIIHDIDTHDASGGADGRDDHAS